MIREQPETDHDLLVSLWTILIGTNGNGLLAKIDVLAEESRNRISALEKDSTTYWKRSDHDAYIKCENKNHDIVKNRRKISLREWLLVTVSVFGPIIAIFISKIL
jgi:hypothetical protein